jgi:hypothetical protein
MYKKILRLIYALVFLLAIITFCTYSNDKTENNNVNFADKILPYIGDLKQYKSIGEMLDSSAVQEGVWYWIDGRKIDIDTDIYYPSLPLKSLKDALVIPAERFFTNYKRVAGHGCAAVMLKKIATPDGQKMLAYREVSIAHWAEEITPEKSVIDAIDAQNLPKGVHYFKVDQQGGLSLTSEGKPVIIKAEDIAFLRCYFRVMITVNPDRTRIVTYERVRPLVMRYVIYEYYPSGFMKTKVDIRETRLMGPPRDGDAGYLHRNADNRDSFIEYTVYHRPFNDKGIKQTTPSDQTVTVLTDRSSLFWVQNILHD